MKKLTRKRFQNKCLFVINATTITMISVWAKLECLNVVVNVSKIIQTNPVNAFLMVLTL